LNRNWNKLFRGCSPGVSKIVVKNGGSILIMKENKKILVLLIMSLFLVFVLIGCANNANGGKVNEGSPEVETEGGAEKAADDKWPERPITIVLPVEPGGLLDVGLRQMQPFLEKELGVPVIVENRSGGQSMLMATYVAEAEPDGYTIGNLGMPHTEISLAILDTEITADSYDYLLINQADIGIIRVKRDDSRFQTLEDYLKYAVDNPGKVTVSVSEMTGPHAFWQYQLGKTIGTSFSIVDFAGGSPARMALVGGHVDSSATNVHGSLHVAEETKVLGVASDENKWPDLTDNAPTVNEVVQKLYGKTVPNMGAYYGFIAPAGLKEKYPQRFEKLVESFEAVLQNPEYLALLKETKEDTKVFYMNSEEMENFFRENVKMYSELAEEFQGIHGS